MNKRHDPSRQSVSQFCSKRGASRAQVSLLLVSFGLLAIYGCGNGNGAGDSVSDDAANASTTNAALENVSAATSPVAQVAAAVSPYVAPALLLPSDTAAGCPAGKSPVVVWTEGSDVLADATNNICEVTLGSADNVFLSGTGSVALLGAGDDTLMAGSGALIRGGPGSDTLNGFSGGIVLGNGGADTINCANGNNYVWPGDGADVVACGTGADTVTIFAVCETLLGEQLNGGSGTDTLVTPVPVSQLQAMGVTIGSFENIIVESHACHAACVQQPTCVHGHCQETGVGDGVGCACDPGWEGPNCDILICSDPADDDADGLRNCDETADASNWTDKAVFNGFEVTEASACHAAPACGLVDSRAEIEGCYDTINAGWDVERYQGWNFQNTQSLSLCSADYGLLPAWGDCAAEPFQLHYRGRIQFAQAGQQCFKVVGSTSNACGSLLVGAQNTAITSAGGATCFNLSAGEYPIRALYETAGVSTPATPIFQADFTSDAAGFVYQDDTFRASNQPNYASGLWSATNGYAGGGLNVTLGGINSTNISKMSGGWKRTITVSAPTALTLSFRYKLTQSPDYEPADLSQVLVSLDGTLRGVGANDYVDQNRR